MTEWAEMISSHPYEVYATERARRKRLGREMTAADLGLPQAWVQEALERNAVYQRLMATDG